MSRCPSSLCIIGIFVRKRTNEEQYRRIQSLRFEGVPDEKNETSEKILEKIIGFFKEPDLETPHTFMD